MMDRTPVHPFQSSSIEHFPPLEEALQSKGRSSPDGSSFGTPSSSIGGSTTNSPFEWSWRTKADLYPNSLSYDARQRSPIFVDAPEDGDLSCFFSSSEEDQNQSTATWNDDSCLSPLDAFKSSSLSPSPKAEVGCASPPWSPITPSAASKIRAAQSKHSMTRKMKDNNRPEKLERRSKKPISW